MVMSWQFAAALVLGGLVQWLGLWQYVVSFAHQWPDAYANAAIVYMFSTTALFLPLQVGLATGDVQAQDRLSGQIRYVLLRTSRASYVSTKMWVGAATGGLVTFIPLVAAGLVAMITMPVRTIPAPFDPYTPAAVKFFPHLLFSHLLVFLILSVLYSTLFGTFLGTLMVLLAWVWKRPFVIAVLPWMAYLLLSELMIRSGVSAVAHMAPRFLITVQSYSSAVMGPVWLLPLWWVALAGAVWLICRTMLQRRDMLD